ncbi:NAD(P)/FAD-dependent oxidoreductase [Caldichromatium japonicum]|uniref:NAD(P)/FAD-dependent oxidoreductase n=1 Tax=Caldichromatium japonicum TaxID=2699430 RepID=A0A6G7VE94_9GAMM|nr:FAD/NAD(P)-binding oxidoreductase [Caldichromatium japonicum]QIK38230.1 NAD(P)/FAD-dependent oxidoreductase [Caldichromatium japonicum]
MHHITIVGSGFGGLTAILELRRRAPEIEITLVSPRPEYVYYPGLIWVPSGLRTGDDLVIDLRPFFERQRVRHLAAEATGLKEGGRVLETTEGPIGNDGLIIACGGRFIKKLPGIEHAIIPCEGVAAAKAIRDRVRALEGGSIAMGFSANPSEPSAVRGGPIFEFLFGLDTQLRREGRRERFTLHFFSSAERPGNRLGPKAVDALLAKLKCCDIQAHLGQRLKGFSDRSVITEGEEFPADLILFMPGLTGNAWFDNTDLPRSPGGLIQADAQCRVPGFARVYVVGDAGSFPGPDWLPKQGHMADLQARAAARNLLAELASQTPKAGFRVELLCILDTNERGMLVGRTKHLNLVLPAWRLFHWLKRFFEWLYLRRYRVR